MFDDLYNDPFENMDDLLDELLNIVKDNRDLRIKDIGDRVRIWDFSSVLKVEKDTFIETGLTEIGDDNELIVIEKGNYEYRFDDGAIMSPMSDDIHFTPRGVYYLRYSDIKLYDPKTKNIYLTREKYIKRLDSNK